MTKAYPSSSLTNASFFSPGSRSLLPRMLSAGRLLLLGIGILGLGLAALGVGTARAEAPSTYMQRAANELVAAQRSGSASAYAAAIRRHADVQSIGLFSLGSYSRSLPSKERPTYYNGMINFISKYASREGNKYAVARVVMMSQTEETRTGAYVDSRVTLKSGDTYDVRWWLVRRGQTYKVRDAQVIGFWMSPFLKNLFEKYIGENGGNPKALVVALNR